MGEQAKRIAEILSAFGLGSIFVVVIGRLWTIAYFDHFGLSTEDLEFTTQDFAFRSLEVLVSLSLAGLGLFVAFSAKAPRRWGDWQILAGVVVCVGVVFFVVVKYVHRWVWFFDFVGPWLTNPGVIGVISGGALFILIFLAAEIWKQVPADVWWTGGWPRLLANQIVAGCLMLGIVFVYLPLITTNLAKLEARLDLRTRDLPVAILETAEGPLPDAIASDDDPTKSNLVRVILAQSDNTYVLHSTECKTIGEFTISRDTDVCKVFAIPTRHLKSIEYRSVTGKPPSEATRIGLREPFVPFEATLFTEGATDDDGIRCLENQDFFHNTVWYEVTAPNEGYLLASVDSLDAGLVPVIGVWPGSKAAFLEPDAAPGSGHAGRACETITVDLPREASGVLGADDKAQRVAVIANLQRNRTYFIGIGAKGELEGNIHVFIQFFPDGAFLNATQAGDLPPTIELPSTLGRVTLELRDFGEDYALRSLQDCVGFTRDICVVVGRGGVRELRDDQGPVTFSLESEEGAEVPFRLVSSDDGDLERTTLEATGLLGAGTWRLITPGRFETFASLTIPALQPNLILAIEGAPAVPQDLDEPPVDAGEARSAFMAVLDLAQIRTELQLEGLIVFASLPAEAPAFLPEEQPDGSDINEELSRLRAILSRLSVQVDAVEQRRQTPEEQGILRDAANLVQKQLDDLDVAATVGECERLCIRIFFISVPAESDVLSEQQPPPNGQDAAPSQ